MSTRRLFVYSGLLASLITGTTFAGRYQRTKDGTTRVWNENPKAGDLVTWSGARDAKGYATGFGTVTWFTSENEVETGSGVAAWLRHIGRQRHYIVTSRESGIMVQGKFEQAPANAEPKKKGRTDISEEQAPSARIEATPKKAQLSPAQEKTISPAPTPSRTPANDFFGFIDACAIRTKTKPALRRVAVTLKSFADCDAGHIGAVVTGFVSVS